MPHYYSNTVLTCAFETHLEDKNCRKKVNKRVRSSRKKDRQVIAATKLTGTAVRATTIAPLEGPITPHTPTKNAKKFPEKSSTTHTAVVTPPVAANENRKLRSKFQCWQDTGDLAKLTFANRSIAASPTGGIAFTLNLGHDAIKAALGHKQGIADYFARRMDRALKEALGYVPQWWGALDIHGERPHFHGGVQAPNNLRPAIELAMPKGGGKWGSKYYQRKQFKFMNPLTFNNQLLHPDQLVTYATRSWGPKIRRLFPVGPLYVMRGGLRKQAREYYEKARDAVSTDTGCAA